MICVLVFWVSFFIQFHSLQKYTCIYCTKNNILNKNHVDNSVPNYLYLKKPHK